MGQSRTTPGIIRAVLARQRVRPAPVPLHSGGATGEPQIQAGAGTVRRSRMVLSTSKSLPQISRAEPSHVILL